MQVVQGSTNVDKHPTLKIGATTLTVKEGLSEDLSNVECRTSASEGLKAASATGIIDTETAGEGKGTCFWSLQSESANNWVIWTDWSAELKWL